MHAAELIVAAWRTCSNKGTVGQMSKPDFVTTLENRLAECLGGREEDTARGLETPQTLQMEQDVNSYFEMDFEDIDWSFWNSID